MSCGTAPHGSMRWIVGQSGGASTFGACSAWLWTSLLRARASRLVAPWPRWHPDCVQVEMWGRQAEIRVLAVLGWATKRTTITLLDASGRLGCPGPEGRLGLARARVCAWTAGFPWPPALPLPSTPAGSCPPSPTLGYMHDGAAGHRQPHQRSTAHPTPGKDVPEDVNVEAAQRRGPCSGCGRRHHPPAGAGAAAVDVADGCGAHKAHAQGVRRGGRGAEESCQEGKTVRRRPRCCRASAGSRHCQEVDKGHD